MEEIYKNIKITYNIKAGLSDEYIQKYNKTKAVGKHIYDMIVKKYGEEILNTLTANGEVMELQLSLEIWDVKLEPTKEGMEETSEDKLKEEMELIKKADENEENRVEYGV